MSSATHLCIHTKKMDTGCTVRLQNHKNKFIFSVFVVNSAEMREYKCNINVIEV